MMTAVAEPTKTETGKVVPTWNYVAVHAQGPIEFFHEQERLLDVVTRLPTLYEEPRAEPWAVDDAPAEDLAAVSGPADTGPAAADEPDETADADTDSDADSDADDAVDDAAVALG